MVAWTKYSHNQVWDTWHRFLKSQESHRTGSRGG
jgi:hypothetical protein